MDADQSHARNVLKAAAPGGPRPATELIDLILRLAHRIRGRWAEQCEQRGLSETRFAVLQAIAGLEETGCSQSQVAAELGLSESNICALIERMRVAGLLFRFRSRSDRRRSVLVLSERGNELVAALRVRQEGESRRLLSALSAEQQQELLSLLELLSAHVEAGPASEGAPTTQASRRAS